MIANHIYFCPLFCCRRHPTPTKEMIEPLLRTAAAVGLNLDISSSKALADSLDRAVVRPFFLSVLLKFITCMLYLFMSLLCLSLS